MTKQFSIFLESSDRRSSSNSTRYNIDEINHSYISIIFDLFFGFRSNYVEILRKITS